MVGRPADSRELGDALALDAALASETEPRVREAIFTGLARIGSPESIAALALRVRSDDASIRTGALDALRTIGVGVLPYLPALLRDRDTDVRLLACDLAIGLPATETTSLLCQVLVDDPDANVCASAVEVIAEAGTPEALPSLRRCAARFPDDSFLAYAIGIALERVAAPLPMPMSDSPVANQDRVSEEDLRRLCEFLYRRTGLILGRRSAISSSGAQPTGSPRPVPPISPAISRAFGAMWTARSSS